MKAFKTSKCTEVLSNIAVYVACNWECNDFDTIGRRLGKVLQSKGSNNLQTYVTWTLWYVNWAHKHLLNGETPLEFLDERVREAINSDAARNWISSRLQEQLNTELDALLTQMKRFNSFRVEGMQ